MDCEVCGKGCPHLWICVGCNKHFCYTKCLIAHQLESAKCWHSKYDNAPCMVYSEESLYEKD